MEEPPQVPENDDGQWMRGGLCTSNMDANESMAVGEEEGSHACDEPTVVQQAGADFPSPVFTLDSHTIGCGR